MSGRVRFDSLDAVRGLGALAVVFWHWQHMVLLNGAKFTWPPLTGPDRRLEPFYVVLQPFYEFGFRAVDLFFVISGFVFFLLYENSIAEKRTPARDFFILRFSRLYPLHFLTLILVAALEYVFLTRTHQTFVYYGYDAQHFLLNLALINAPNYSFNGPTWALTVEALLYILFWPLARAGVLKGWVVTTLLTAFGIWLLLTPELSVWGRGIAGFFAGGLACKLYGIARDKRALGNALIAFSVLGWVVTLWMCYARPVLWGGVTGNALVWALNAQFWTLFYVLFPISILALAIVDTRKAKAIPGFGWIGSISYSAYVIHFPLQLIIATAVVYGFGPRDFGFSPLAQIGFFAVLLVLSRLIFVYLEEPLQVWFRRTFIRPPTQAAAPSPATTGRKT